MPRACKDLWLLSRDIHCCHCGPVLAASCAVDGPSAVLVLEAVGLVVVVGVAVTASVVNAGLAPLEVMSG